MANSSGAYDGVDRFCYYCTRNFKTYSYFDSVCTYTHSRDCLDYVLGLLFLGSFTSLRTYKVVTVKKLLLALILLTCSACRHDPSQTSIVKVLDCWGNYGTQTCNVVYEDGNEGYVVKQFYNATSYACRKGGI